VISQLCFLCSSKSRLGLKPKIGRDLRGPKGPLFHCCGRSRLLSTTVAANDSCPPAIAAGQVFVVRKGHSASFQARIM
jgi:hypothetical protein